VNLPHIHPRRRALSLAELLVVLAIISLVAVIAIPTVTTHMERARIATAYADCRALAQSEETCNALHGLYVPLQVLDDLPFFVNISSTDEDVIDNEAGSGIQLIDPLIPADVQQGILGQPDLSFTDSRGEQLINEWAGPFIEFQRATNQPNPTTSSDARRDFPLDPWGQPYRFFSGEGAIGGSQATSAAPIDDLDALDSSGWGNGNLTDSLDRCDRYAIVSTGRDLTLDDNNVIGEFGDDIVYVFGIVGFESGALVRPPTRTPTTFP
jgi:prepilin-type N-terminal cleavage/methylation domain-containing protein